MSIESLAGDGEVDRKQASLLLELDSVDLRRRRSFLHRLLLKGLLLGDDDLVLSSFSSRSFL